MSIMGAWDVAFPLRALSKDEELDVETRVNGRHWCPATNMTLKSDIISSLSVDGASDEKLAHTV